MGSYSEEMKKMNHTGDDTIKNTCWHDGCPMKVSVISGGLRECHFHQGQKGAYHRAITTAIKHNLDLIRNYNKLVKYEDWTNPKMLKWLDENTLLPIKENEPVSMYISRYFEWLTEKVLWEASVTE